MPPRIQLLLANRAYLDHAIPRAGGQAPTAAVGGLVAAVHSLIEPWDTAQGTTWIGAGRGQFDHEWTDNDGFELLDTPRGPLRHRRLYFADDAWAGHYNAVANGFLWPLLHLVRSPLPEITGYYPAPLAPSSAAWADFESVNSAFAEAAISERPFGQTCWVHDYQLALVPELLKRGGYKGPVGFFLHTPFPDYAVARRYLNETSLARFGSCIAGILGADIAGFQTEDDAQRFRIAAVQLGLAQGHDGVLTHDGHETKVAAYPVGIDTQELASAAASATLPARFAAIRAQGMPLVVGLERSDYTKGIPERLRAIAAAYRSGVRFAYIGVAAPTRAGVAAYDRLEQVISEAAADAREAAAAAPFLHLHEAIAWREVVALQREADVVFTSSLADGMNLVPPQAIIAQALRPAAERGTVITGRDAGVASIYAGFANDGLVPVDPLDATQMVDVLQHAIRHQPGRISDRLIRAVQDHDAHAWATSFLGDLEATC